MEFELNEAREILERTPVTLSALLRGLSEEWLRTNEGDGTFSPRDVLGHLITGEEDDWIPRAERILDHGVNVPFEPFDRFAFRKVYGHQPVSELLEIFSRLRAESLKRLDSLALGPRELDLQGLHPDLGKVTLRQLLATWVAHDLAHVRQIVRVMAKAYRSEVGPWRNYMPVMDE